MIADESWWPISDCRVCGSQDLDMVLSLGEQPLANALVRPEDSDVPPPEYPLTLARCEGCGLVQLRETVDPEELFSDYLYHSSCATALVESARDLVSEAIRRFDLGRDDLAVDVGSNDGFLLQFYDLAGIPVVGVEPADNVAAVARRERGIRTVTEFFDEGTAAELVAEFGPASVIHAHNVIAHVEDLHGFTQGLRELLCESGIVIVEAAYVKDMVEAGSFDQIYHEHLCYYSLATLSRLLAQHGLAPFDVERIASHGGSLRIYAAPSGARDESDRLVRLRDEEEKAGVNELDFVQDFGEQVESLRREFLDVIRRRQMAGKRIAAYGAAAKTTVLLNYFDLDSDTVQCVADRNVEKQGKIVPGCGLPVVSPRELIESAPDCVLVTAWNYREEIISQLLAAGLSPATEFLVPLPALELFTPAEKAEKKVG